jgi:hypothetical protein
MKQYFIVCLISHSCLFVKEKSGKIMMVIVRNHTGSFLRRDAPGVQGFIVARGFGPMRNISRTESRDRVPRRFQVGGMCGRVISAKISLDKTPGDILFIPQNIVSLYEPHRRVLFRRRTRLFAKRVPIAFAGGWTRIGPFS